MDEYPSEIHKLLGIGNPEKRPFVEHAPASLPIEHKTIKHTAGNTAAMPAIELRKVQFKSLLIYPVIFLAAFFFFYALLNFPAMVAQIQGFFSKPQAMEILGDNSAAFYKWISNYFYAVGDAKLLEPTNDIDRDGLSNQDEFKMRTNPIVADSDSDGFSDGIEVINSTNPWGFGSLTRTQRELADKLDLIMINNRIGFNVSQNHSGTVSGANNSNYDLEKPGRLSIPKLNMSIPLIWSKDPANFASDLTKGVIHYPGTFMPGESGIVYVSGHSSDYFWKKNPMQNVFAKLNHLSAGDDVFVDVYGKDGKVYNFRYQVAGNQIFKPDDQAQFFDSSGSKLNLSTCWPIGTSKDRLVVTAVPVGL